MQLQRSYSNLRFPETVLRKAIEADRSLSSSPGEESSFRSRSPLDRTNGVLTMSRISLATFQQRRRHTFIMKWPLSENYWRCILTYSMGGTGSLVSVDSRLRSEIHAVMNIFQESVGLAAPLTKEQMAHSHDFKIFIRHGQSRAWEEMRDHLQDKHGYKVLAF